MQALFLGIRGVLVPEHRFHLASIQAAARCLSGAGVDPADFHAAARRRLKASGPLAIVSRTLNDLKVRPAPQWVRRGCREAAIAVPSVRRDDGLRASLRFLASAVRLAFVERGPAAVLEALLARLGLTDVAERRLWLEQLGHDAAPPRGLAFRWLARRLELRPRDVLYVAGADAMHRAARRAGCRSLRCPAAEAGNVEWLIERLEWSEQRCPSRASR